MNRQLISISDFNKFVNNPDLESQNTVLAFKSLQADLHVNKIIKKAKEQLSEHDYNFLVNNSRDSLTKLINLYSDFVGIVSEEQEQINDVNQHIAHNQNNFMNASEAETMGERIQNHTVSSQRRAQNRRNSKRVTKNVDSEENQDNTIENEGEDNKE